MSLSKYGRDDDDIPRQEAQNLLGGEEQLEPGEISNTDSLFQVFKKTDQLEPGRYKVRYLRKIKTKFGTRIRCYTEDFNYDLPQNFVIQLHKYDLDHIDYTNVFLKYIGRRDDAYRTILMRLQGMPTSSTQIVASTSTSESTTANPALDDIRTDVSSNSTTPTSSTSVSSSSSSSSSGVPQLLTPNTSGWITIRPIQPKRPSGLTTTKNSPPSSPPPIDNLCKICYNGTVDTAILQCGHRLCYGCGSKHIKKPCPFCRKKVVRIIRTYDS